MKESPEQIRADIERTRKHLGMDVDVLADKVSPSKIVQRQTSKLKGAMSSAKDHVFGVADDHRWVFLIRWAKQRTESSRRGKGIPSRTMFAPKPRSQGEPSLTTSATTTARHPGSGRPVVVGPRVYVGRAGLEPATDGL